jgi:RimJ/RimL family protein N-acetyltransferase
VSESPQDLSLWSPVPLPRPVPLHGLHVTLEPLNAVRHTADLWQAVQGHDEVWTYLADGPYPDEAALCRALEEKQTGSGAVFFAIVPQTTEYVAGYASYMRMDPANGAIEVGNILLTPSLQRTIAATEAMYLMARHIFEDLGYRRYEWKCNTNNAPSRRAAQRLGFTFEGIFRQHMVIKGRNRDTAWFSMLDSEWPARKTAFEAWLDPANFDDVGHQIKSLARLQGCTC